MSKKTAFLLACAAMAFVMAMAFGASPGFVFAAQGALNQLPKYANMSKA